MTHMVFMKFEEGFFCDAVLEEIQSAYLQLQAAVPELILSAKVLKNCVKRDTNMDLLIALELSDATALEGYLHHPIHLAIGQRMNPHVVNRCSFDCR